MFIVEAESPCNQMFCDIFFFAKLNRGSTIEQVWVILSRDGPKLLAFLDSFFDNIASSQDWCDIVLGDHPPKVLDCIRFWALGANDFLVCAKGTVDIARIDVVGVVLTR